jgi:hypothetical protein
MKISIDIAKLNAAIEAAFTLGKMYAADEFASTGIKTPPIANNDPMFHDKWNDWVENNGGHGLHSGDAKREIMTELVMSGDLGDALQFD